MVTLLSSRNVIVYLQTLKYREAEERDRQRRLRRLESWTVAQNILARLKRQKDEINRQLREAKCRLT